MRVAIRLSLLFASLSVGAFIPAHAQNLLTNGGFETGDFTGYQTANLDGTAVAVSGFFYPSHSGNFFAALGNVGPGIITQTLSDTPGALYDFSFFLASDGSPNTFSAMIDGTTVFGPAMIPMQDYTLYSFDFTGTGSDTVGFTEEDDSSFLALDDVSVTPAASAVPEPSSLVLIATGMAGMTGAWRRRIRLS